MRPSRRPLAFIIAALCFGMASPVSSATAAPSGGTSTAEASAPIADGAPTVRATTPGDAPDAGHQPAVSAPNDPARPTVGGTIMTATGGVNPAPLDPTARRAARAARAAAPGDVARALRRRQIFLTVVQTRSVQRRLGVAADGIWGADTVAAARRYQRRRGLAVVGFANVETLRRMGLRVASRFEASLWAARAAARRRSISAAAPSAAAALRTARTAVGVPYRWAGTTLNGFDCSGLVQWAYRSAGRELPRRSFEQYQRGWAITKGAIRPGDLVFFDAAGPGASHVGIAASRTTVISATSSSGVVEHDIARGYWAEHYVGARRLAKR